MEPVIGSQEGGWKFGDKILKSGQHPKHLANGTLPSLENCLVRKCKKCKKSDEKRFKIGRRGSVRTETLAK